MAAPSYATDLVDIYTDTDNFSLVGGGRVTAAETDDYIQGSNCWSHDPFSSSIEGGVYDTVTAPTIASGSVVLIWTKCDVVATLATHANGGVQGLMGNSATALKCYYLYGSDDAQDGKWLCIPIDPTKTPSTNIGTPSGTLDHFGIRWNVPSTGASKGYPMKIDAIRHGKTIEITAGDGTTPATWTATAIYDFTTARRWGLVHVTNSGAAIQGNVYWGTAATAVYSREANKTIEIINTEWTDTDFTQIIFAHASNDVVWDNISIKALGTSNRGIIDVTANGAITWTNSVFEGIDITNLLASSTFDGSKWLSTNEVTAGGASLLGCKILAPTVAADSHGLLWNTATDPDGELDGMEFSKGTNAHHAIEFDVTNTPTTITLRNIDFTGFNATNGNNDSALYFPSTSKSYTVNLVGCSGDISYKVGSGGSVTLVLDPKSFSFTINPSITGYEWRLYSVTAIGSLVGATELDGEEVATADNQSYSYSYSSDIIVAVQIIALAGDYEESTTYYTLKNADQDQTINLKKDLNN